MKCAGILIAILLMLMVASIHAEPPNILLIISDDQAWSDYGFMGHPEIRTPNLDRLASEGLLFPYGYVPASLCRPSLATIITGLFPHQHRITGNDPARPAGLNRKDPEYRKLNEQLINRVAQVPTLPRLLAQAGFLSFQSGKWWEGHYRRGGFTHGMTHGNPDQSGRHGDEGLKIGREGLRPIFDFIEQAEEKPFFIWYAPFLPHTPHTPPDRLLTKYLTANRPVELSRYYAMCEWFDETVGGLLTYLDVHGLEKDTLVLFVTDNGWIQRTPKSVVPSAWNFRFEPKSKRSPNEGGIRTPIILRWPGRVPVKQVDTPVSSVDIAPTILESVGLSRGREMQGVNLADLAEVASRSGIFGAVFTHDVMDLADPLASLKNRWGIQGNWKLIVPHSTNIRDSDIQLYDIVADPGETKNLTAKQPGKTRELHALIQKWWRVD
jgi:uncharacterized sulfatase